MAYTLVIANKRCSSWSLRPWLLMKVAGIPFHEETIFLKKQDTAERIKKYSHAGRVPILIDGHATVWESLAICEYLAEHHSEKRLWPEDSNARAHARSVSNEMHAGFTALRSNCPMNCATSVSNFRPSEEVLVDIERVSEIWREARKQHGKEGDFLFGGFSIADAMYAPVASRFKTYSISVDHDCRQYMEAIISLPAMQEWIRSSQSETERISAYEITLK